MSRDQEALGPLEAKEAALDRQVQDVRTKKNFVDRLEDYQQRLREARERQEELREETKSLKAHERELETLLSTPGTA